MITVVVPVGPSPAYRAFLPACLESIRGQDEHIDQILVIDDMAHLEQADVGYDVTLWKTPWLSGVSHSFNFGVALARNPLIFMLGSDDRLEPWCIADCLRSYKKHKDQEAYYYVDVQYSDGRSQNLACHAAMVTKGLWRLNGGFPFEAAVGAPDTILISAMMAAKGKAGRLIHVDSPKPPYWYRVHPDTDTLARSSRFYGAICGVREEFTNHWHGVTDWRPPAWTV